MAVVNFTAVKQTTFTTPIEGTDSIGGLTITRANQISNNSAVLTVNSLSLEASVANSYGVYVNAPIATASNTITDAYGAYVSAPSGTITNAYTMRLAGPTAGGTLNYSLLSDGKIKVSSGIDTDTSGTFNLVNTNASTVNLAGAATAVHIGASASTTNIHGDLSVASGKTFQVNGTTVLSGSTLGSGVTGSSLTSVGTISSGTWNGSTVGIGYGGTGSNDGSITGSSTLSFTAGGSNNNVNLIPTGTGTVDVNGARITNVGTPTQSTDGVNKAYVDTYRTGLDVKDSVHVATTADISSLIANASNDNSFTIDSHAFTAASFTGVISGTTLTVSSVTGTLEPEHIVLGTGVSANTFIVQQLTGTTGKAGTYQVSITHNLTSRAMTSGMRVLVKDQTSSAQNGIYIAKPSAWVRAADFPAGISADVAPGVFVFVGYGSTNANMGYVLQSTGTIEPIDVGTTAISFAPFSGAGQVSVTAPLLKTGNALSIDTTVVATTTNSIALTNKTYEGLTLTADSTGFSVAGGTTSKTLAVRNSLTLAGTDGTTMTFPSTSGNVVIQGGALGAATATSINGLTISSTTGTLSIANGKTLTASNSLTFAGTDGTTMTFPSGSGNVVVQGGALGAATATSINGLTISTTTGTLSISNGKTLAASNSLTFAGTDGTTMTFPSSSGNVVIEGGTLGAASATSINGLSLTANSTGFSIAGGTSSRTLTISNTLTFQGMDNTTFTFPASNGTVVIQGGALGAATATSINGLTITSTTGTLTIASGKTFTSSNTLTLQGTDASVITFPVGTGNAVTVADLVTAQTLQNKTLTNAVYAEFDSQTTPAAPSGTVARLYNKSGSLYLQNATAEYQILSKANAPFFNLGASSAAPAAAYRRVGMYLLYGTTTNSNITRVTSVGATSATTSNVIQLPTGIGSTWFTKVYITAWNVDDSAGAAWEVSAVFRKTATAGTLMLLGDPVVIAASDTNQTGLEITLQADNATVSDSIDISVKGLASKTINWTVNVQTTEAG